MNLIFYVSSISAIISVALVITRSNAMRALVYLVLFFLSIAGVFFSLGASFIALLQITIYAGAIMVLFVFVVMMLNLGRESEHRERNRFSGRTWILPAILAVALMGQFILALARHMSPQTNGMISPKAVGINLFTTYFAGVELASFVLIAALLAAYRLGYIADIFEDSHE